MCQTKAWKYITPNIRKELIYATRTDGAVFKFNAKDFLDIFSFLKTLESYTNCKCTPTTFCPYHFAAKTKRGELR